MSESLLLKELLLCYYKGLIYWIKHNLINRFNLTLSGASKIILTLLQWTISISSSYGSSFAYMRRHSAGNGTQSGVELFFVSRFSGRIVAEWCSNCAATSCCSGRWTASAQITWTATSTCCPIWRVFSGLRAARSRTCARRSPRRRSPATTRSSPVRVPKACC